MFKASSSSDIFRIWSVLSSLLYAVCTASSTSSVSRIDLYQLRVGEVYEVAVVSNTRKISAFGDFFGMLRFNTPALSLASNKGL